MAFQSIKQNSRVAVVGVGQVGSAAAYALILGSVANELLLVDIKPDLRDVQVHDLSDAAHGSVGNTRVREATHEEAGQCDIIVITAGSKYYLGETSTMHMYRNISILRSVMQAMKPFRSDAIILVVANPVDLLTSIAREVSELPPSQVLGSGTYLDSVRLRGFLSEQANIPADSIDLNVLGVRGSSQVVAWSTATVNGVPLEDALPHHALNHAQLVQGCNKRSHTITRMKGATPFGIGAIVARICSDILLDSRHVCPVSHFQPKYGHCFSWPAVLGRAGVISSLEVSLNDSEQKQVTQTVDELGSLVERFKMA